MRVKVMLRIGLLLMIAQVILMSVRVDAAPIQPVHSPGSGGVIRIGYYGYSRADWFSPLDCSYNGSEVLCSAMGELLFPRLIGIDPATGQIAPNVSNALAWAWEISDDGLEYTIHLRDNLHWSDGTPITAKDVSFSFDRLLETYASFSVETIEQLEVIDETTVRFTLSGPDCGTFANLSFFILPAHKPNLYDPINQLFDPSIDISGGLFRIQEWGDEIITFTPNPSPNLELTILPAALEFHIFPDIQTMITAFEAGEIDVVLHLTDHNIMQQLQTLPDIQIFEYPSRSYDYIGLNLADPDEPMDGVDDNGDPVIQPPHPILADVKVRQALQYAIDVDLIVKEALLGFGTVMGADGTLGLPTGLAPVPYDPERARQLLAEAGWVRDADGGWVARSSDYAPEGTELVLDFITNAGNTRRETALTIIQSQLGEVGIEVYVQAVDFNTLLDTIDAQTFDGYMLGWRNFYPGDPDLSDFFSIQSDELFSGLNFGSYYNPNVEQLMEVVNEAPGCGISENMPLYAELSRVLQEDQPYLWLYMRNEMYVASDRLTGWTPYPDMPLWNVQNWSVNG